MHTTENLADIHPLTDVELNQVSGGFFSGFLGDLMANRRPVAGGDVNWDGIPDAIVS